MVSELSIRGVSSVGKICSDVPCNSLSDLDKDGAHGTNAHQLFDGMPSQHEVSEDDSRIHEKSLDDALDQIMEKLELMEARRRQNEKIDRILEKFNEMEKKERESMQRRRASWRSSVPASKRPLRSSWLHHLHHPWHHLPHCLPTARQNAPMLAARM
jgi:hypothetical protein